MKILILQTAFIGDVILAEPLIEGITKKYPGAEISFLTIPYSAPVLMNHPRLQEILVFDKRGKGRWKRTAEMIENLAAKKFDLAVVPHRSFRSAAMVWLAGIPERTGFGRSAGKFLLTKTVSYRKDWHEVRRNLSLIGLEDETIAPRIYPGEREVRQAERFLDAAGIADSRFITLAPGSIWETKKWPEEHYHRLAGLIGDELNLQMVLIGGNSERDICERVAGDLKHVHLAAGHLNPLESAALVSKAEVMIANDSAAGHIAAAVGTKVVSIFGPTLTGFGFAPYGEGNAVIEHPDLYCRPCRIHGSHQCPEKHFRCMLEVTTERVLEEIVKMMKTGR